MHRDFDSLNKRKDLERENRPFGGKRGTNVTTAEGRAPGGAGGRRDPPKKGGYFYRLGLNIKKYTLVYLLMLVIVAYYVLFHYVPLLGNIIAFKDFKPALGIADSEWVRLQNFRDFFKSPFAWRVIRNTLKISGLQMLIGFPAPIILALMFNEVRGKYFKKITQTISYLPHFISLVVVCGILIDFTSSDGVITKLLTLFGVDSQNLLTNPTYYVWIFVLSGVWQNIGWGSIIYIATLSGVDQALYEAASIDGAGRLQKIIHVSLPALTPMIAIQLIMRVGNLMSLGAEKTILLYGPSVYETADTISSYVYRMGLQQRNYSFAAAVGMFNSVINFLLVVFANWFSRKCVEESLW